MHILALEASKNIDQRIEDTLSSLQIPYHLLTHKHGAISLNSAFNEKIDAIILSDLLEDMGGFDFCMAFNKINDKNHIFSKHPPAVILITDEKNLDHDFKKAALKLGISAIFHRSNPVELVRYLTRVNQKQNRQDKNEYKILLIEDSKSMRHHAVQCLQMISAKIIQCDSAEQALIELYDTDIDLIITSLVLKGKLSGKTLIRTVRYFEDSKSRIPILVVSSSEDNSTKIELLKVGASDFIHKPFIPQEFITRAKNLIENKKLLDQIEEQSGKLQEIALIDQLTKLYNRHYLMEVGPRKITECIRHKIPCSLLVLDLDHFKSINDNYGHAMGDIVLRETANTIKSQCRGEDIVARFGGEEFVLLLSHCNLDAAIQKAENIRKKIEALKPENIPISASIGIAQISEKNADFTSLFQGADEQVYVAKANGRNQIRYQQ